ncbi:MAG: hypothetical protein M1815_005497 [Lichina confinis]|nr:MAG: hypothetical protein M1815_005497 [Lichina confinis]
MAPHAGMPQGHPMTTGHPPNPNQVVVSHAPGQVVQQQQMHGMVSGPGSVQASQGGAAMGGIPTAVSTGAGVGPSAHALSHLNPGQAHLLQQQQLSKSIFLPVRIPFGLDGGRRKSREIVRCPDSVGFVVPSNVGNRVAHPCVVFLTRDRLYLHLTPFTLHVRSSTILPRSPRLCAAPSSVGEPALARLARPRSLVDMNLASAKHAGPRRPRPFPLAEPRCFVSSRDSLPLRLRSLVLVLAGSEPLLSLLGFLDASSTSWLLASNPQLYHHQIMRHRQAQAAQQALLQSQQNGGGPVGMPHGAAAGGMAGPNAVINASRLAAMQNQAGLRTVNLPDHMQQQQLAAQAAAAAAQQQQQQQQQQHHQQQQYQMQHQHLLAQQAAVQQANAAAAAQGRAHGQPGPLGAQQQMQMMQSPQAIAAAQQQAHVQAQQQAQAHAQAQVQAQAHAAAHQSHPGASAMMQPRAANPLKGRFLLQMMQFADHLSNFADLSWGNDLAYWQKFVDQFFSQSGILRQQLLCQADSSSKQYEISTSALPRYYCTHFESGVRKIQMILENAREREVPNHCHYVESPKASFIYWFESGSQLVSSGTLRAQFDHDSKIDVLEFVTTNHCEYLSRHRLKALLAPHSPPEDKSPKQNKAAKARAARQQQPPPPPPPAVAPVLPVVPESHVNPYGVTPAVLNFLELAETISHMQPLFQFSQQHAELTPSEALSELVATFQSQSQFGGTPMIMPQNHAFQMAGQHQQHQHQQHPQHPQHHQHQHLPPSVVGTPHMVPQSLAGAAMVHQLSVGASPSQAHLALPGSPHTMSHPSPGQNGVNAMQAPGLVAQHSQQGTNSSSQGTSANTSPNASNKRRRASGVKVEADDPGGGGGGSVMEMNGGGGGGPGGGAANANGGAAGGTAGGANPGAGAAGAAGAGGGGGASTGVTAAAAAASKVKPSPRLGGGGGGGAGGGNKKQKAGAAAAAAAAAHA